MFQFDQLLIVLLGGGIGSVTRYIVTLLISSRFGSIFPFGTLCVNLIGCFIMGFFMIFTSERVHLAAGIRLLITVGFLGGLTTFSSFSYETIQLLREGNTISAFLNISANLILGLLAVWMGIFTAKFI